MEDQTDTLPTIHKGWINKWTNIMSAWRPRYFSVEPGLLKYSLIQSGPTKETFLLAKCKIRICPGDPVRLEVETPDSGTLFLRTDSSETKGQWYAAIKQAQAAVSQRKTDRSIYTDRSMYTDRSIYTDRSSYTDRSINNDRSSDRSIYTDISNDKCDPLSSNSPLNTSSSRQSLPVREISGTSHELSPLLCLIEYCMACRQHVQMASSDIRRLQAQLIQRIGTLHTQSMYGANVPEDIKSVAIDLVERASLLQSIIEKQLSQTETLISEEAIQRRQLEKSLKWLAKQNYKMEKAQQKSIDNGGPLEIPKQHSSHSKRKPVCNVNNEKKEINKETNNRKSDLDVQNELVDSSESEYEEVTFFECEEFDDKRFYTTSIQKIKSKDRSKTAPPSASILAFKRRTVLPCPRIEFKLSIWTILKDCLGKDLSRISMPVYFNEPTSFLQRLAEDFQYAELIKKSTVHKGSTTRLAWIAIFSVSQYASALGRTYKPFNPLLGETYEYSHRGYNFLAEQVGHHPPVTAYHAENEDFVSWGHLFVKTKLSGKSLEVTMPGMVHLLLTENGDHFTFHRAKMLVHNIIFGKLWIELDGFQIIRNHSTKEYCIIQFLRKGWFEKCGHEIRGLVFDKNNVPCYRIGGTWNAEAWTEKIFNNKNDYNNKVQENSLKVAPSLEAPMSEADKDLPPSFGPRDEDSAMLLLDDWESQPIVEGTKEVVWKSDPRPYEADKYYGFGYMTMELNELSPDYDPAHMAVMPPTDSRFRPDQRYYEQGLTDLATEEKLRLEERQRSAARARPNGEAEYSPRWFEMGRDHITGDETWVYKGEYWEAKEKGEFTDCPDIF